MEMYRTGTVVTVWGCMMKTLSGRAELRYGFMDDFGNWVPERLHMLFIVLTD